MRGETRSFLAGLVLLVGRSNAAAHTGISGGIVRDDLEAALAALDGRDEAFLDYTRLNPCVNEWQGRDRAAEEARRIHRERLGTATVPACKDALWRIDRAFPTPDRETEALRR